MDQVKIGKFILNLRKKYNLTQSEFADKLNVTSQAVSKWENGRGLPDISLLKQISQEFNVDISDILDGEVKKKKKNHSLLIIGSIFTILLVGLIIYLIFNDSGSFNFSTISSNSSDFSITGVVAYSNDKKSIYISNINYKDVSNNEKYVVAECTLYESHGQTDEIISKCGDISDNTNYDKNTAQPLSDLLKQISINVSDYSASCSNLKSNDLYLVIKALNVDNNIVSYTIPLTLDDNCDD